MTFRHTWGLGGSSALLVAVLLITGVLQMFAYDPSPAGAYASLQALRSDTLFGTLVHSVHHWSANLLVIVAVLHLLRVFLTGAYDGPRRFNWVLGLGLLLAIMGANFTGYLLPWNQLSYWAVTICTGMLAYIPWIGDGLQELVRGGVEVGYSTLLLFFTFHTTVVPVLLLVLMGFHFWRVRKAGGVIPPRPLGQHPATDLESVDFVPNLLLREAAVGTLLVLAVLLLAIFWPVQLGEPANPGMSPNPAKAPWYFLGFQELQLHFHPLFAVVIIPLATLVALMLLPYFRASEDPTAGTFLASKAGRRGAAWSALASLVATPLLVLADEYGRSPSGWLSGLDPWIRTGIFPVVILMALAVAFLGLLRARLGLRGREVDQTVGVLLGTSFLVLTVIGILMRGPGMELKWPW